MKFLTACGIINSLIVITVSSEHQKVEKLNEFFSQNESEIGFLCEYDLENINTLDIFRSK